MLHTLRHLISSPFTSTNHYPCQHIWHPHMYLHRHICTCTTTTTICQPLRRKTNHWPVKYQLILKLLPPVLRPYKVTSTNPPTSWHHKLSALGAGHHLTPTLQFQSLQLCRGGTPTSLPFPFTLQTPSSLPFLAMLHRLPPPPLLRHLHTPTPPSFSALRSALRRAGNNLPPSPGP